MNASVTYLRRMPDQSLPSGKKELWGAHMPACPQHAHRHVIWAPWADAPAGTVNQATQAGFALHGFEKMAMRWEVPWYITLVVD